MVRDLARSALWPAHLSPDKGRADYAVRDPHRQAIHRMNPPDPLRPAIDPLRLVRNALVVLVLMPVLGYYWWSVEIALERATIHARALASVIAASGEAQPMRDEHLRRVLEHEHLAGSGRDLRAVIAPNGRTLFANDGFESVSWPHGTLEAPVMREGVVLGLVQVRTPLRGILLTVLLLGAFAAGVAVLVWRYGIARSTIALHEAEEKLKYISTRDPLTGLMNRDGLRPRITRGIERSTRVRRTAAVLVVDLDRFRMVNETLGNQAGDRVLRAVAERLRAVTRRTDVVARLGVDQFAVLVEGLADPRAVDAMAQNILRALDAPLILGGRDLVTSASIGIALAPTHGVEADAILKAADAAMLIAKRNGGRRARTYDAGMLDNTSMQFEIGNRLRRALEARELFLMFQPIVDVRSGRVNGLEALLRWTSSDGLEMGPAHFVPVLEQTGLIVPAGQWVLEEACRQGRAWIDDGAPHLVISVNMSPRQFAEPDFLDMVQSVLSQTGFPATNLQLEVTEGLLLDPTADGLRRIEELARLGVRIAVDDFGMGYSSLAYLRRFRLHALKIDRAFVTEMTTQEKDALIVRAVVNLGHGLGLSVTAEGVETAGQFRMLRAMGCDAVQGYLFGRPALTQDVPALIARGAMRRHGTPADPENTPAVPADANDAWRADAARTQAQARADALARSSIARAAQGSPARGGAAGRAARAAVPGQQRAPGPHATTRKAPVTPAAEVPGAAPE